MRGACLGVTVLMLALALSATAVAAGGYRVRDAAWSRPSSGSLFSVNAHGVAVQKALLYVYLDTNPCRTAWASEATRFSFTAGASSFRDAGRPFITLWVSGRFNNSFTARAGTTPRREYACAYLTTPNSHGHYKITAARASNAFTVTS